MSIKSATSSKGNVSSQSLKSAPQLISADSNSLLRQQTSVVPSRQDETGSGRGSINSSTKIPPIEGGKVVGFDDDPETLLRRPRLKGRGKKGRGKKGGKGRGKMGKKGKKGKKMKTEPIEKADKMTFYQVTDQELEDKLHELELNHYGFSKDMKSKTEDLRQSLSLQEDSVKRAKTKLLGFQNKDLVVRNLKAQIERAIEADEVDIAERLRQQKSLAIENKLSAGMFLESQVGSEKEAMRSKCLYRCPQCEEIVLERAQNYARLLKRVWEDNASERMLDGSWKHKIDQMIEAREAALEQVIKRLWDMHGDFERAAEVLLNNFVAQVQQNDLESRDYHRTLVKLEEAKKLFESVKEEFDAAKNKEAEFKFRHSINTTQQKELKKQLKRESTVAKNRHGLIKKKEHVKYLQQQLDTERATQKKLQLRREKLQYNMEYVKESFKYSEQVRKQQTRDVKFSVLPQIQKETTELTEQFQEKSEELDECRELLGKRRNLLEKVKKQHWDLSQALQLNLITKSHCEEKIEDNEITLTQVESDLRSTSHFLKSVMEEPEKNKRYIEDLMQLQKEAKRWLSKMERNCSAMKNLVSQLNANTGLLFAKKKGTSKRSQSISNELQSMSSFKDADQFYSKLQTLVIAAFQDSGFSYAEIEKLKEACNDIDNENNRVRNAVLDVSAKIKKMNRAEASTARGEAVKSSRRKSSLTALFHN